MLLLITQKKLKQFMPQIKHFCDCKHCGVAIEEAAPSHSRKFCSHKCRREAEYIVRIKLWLEENKQTTKATIRKYLAEKHKGCYVCNRVSWRGKKLVLDLDHIDGCAFNNRPENLRLICPNCHSQTPTYKAKNIGRGRKLGNNGEWLLR